MTVNQSIRSWAMRGALGVGAVAMAGLLIAGATPRFVASPNLAASTVAASGPVVPGAAPTSYADVVDRAAPAVVTIYVEKRVNTSQMMQPGDDDFLQRFFGQSQGRQPQGRRNMPAPVERGLGSGVIVSPDGNILTNNHVVDGAQTVRVTLSDGQEYVAKVVGTDPKTDLAVVHINATDLPVLPLGNSDKVRVGDVVLAVGNPLGVGETVTMGIISAKGRTTDVGDGNYEDFLQTDAPINQGNSGGALMTTTGELIGINSQIMSPSGGNIGIGFAIPSNMAKSVMSQLISTGHVRRGLLGTTVQTLTSDLAKSMGLSSRHGALVSEVTPDGPAAKAGLKQGDVILKLNDQDVENSNDLRNRVSAMTPGTAVRLDIQRAGARQTLNATLGEVSEQGAPAPAQPSSGSDFGLTVQPLTPDLARQYRVPAGTTGVIVTSVEPSSPAANAGLHAGDMLRQVNGQSIRSADALRGALAQRHDRPSYAYVQRGDQTFYAAIPSRG
jgi:Do/DeqQ family serine protease